MPVHSQKLFKELVDIFDLPKNVTDLEIHLGVRKIVTVKCTFYPEVVEAEVITRLKNYVLEEQS